MRALSIRQPYAEMILRGVKRIEYRSRPTHIRERVYIYAAMAPGDQDNFKSIKSKMSTFASFSWRLSTIRV